MRGEIERRGGPRTRDSRVALGLRSRWRRGERHLAREGSCRLRVVAGHGGGVSQALEQAAIDSSALSHVDLYSCFPIAVQLGARLLGLPTDGTRPLTVTGGLPYFGGAGNNYALHAVATMVERLRERPGALGLVSALGWYLTKHAVGVYGSAPPGRPWARPSPKERQPMIDALPHPEFVRETTGRGTVETYTVLHDREGAPSEGIIVVQCEDGRRTLALMEASPDVLGAFEAEDLVGAPGLLSSRSDGRLELRLRGA